MKSLALAVPIALSFAAPALAQPKAVHFKVLQESLPTTQLAGFTRGKVTGSTQTAMGMTSSEAAIRYEQPGSGEAPVSVTVKISDLVGVPFAAMALQVVPAVDQESETETGHQKTVTVRSRFRAHEEVENGETKSCKLMVPVANRFMVELEGSGTSEVKLLHTLVEGMALEKLESAAR